MLSGAIGFPLPQIQSTHLKLMAVDLLLTSEICYAEPFFSQHLKDEVFFSLSVHQELWPGLSNICQLNRNVAVSQFVFKLFILSEINRYFFKYVDSKRSGVEFYVVYST